MRVQIKTQADWFWTWKYWKNRNWSEEYRLGLPDDEISVRRDGRRATWTWTDGKQYTLEYPTPTFFKKMWWHIYVDGQKICSGVWRHPSAKDTIFKAALLYIEWHFDNEIVLEESWYCSNTLRLANGRRLAVSRRCGDRRVVCRDNHPTIPVPAIIAMILANKRDLYPSSGS